jgi:hypothetical protein
VSEILALRKKKAPSTSQEQQVSSIFSSLLRDKSLDRTAVDLINTRLKITREQLTSP